MFWTSERTGDVSGLMKNSIRKVPLGYRFTLDRTKTTGAGRVVVTLPVYVANQAYSVYPGWFKGVLPSWKN